MAEVVPPPYVSFSALLLGQVNTSDVMSWVRSSRKRAAVTSLFVGRVVSGPLNGSGAIVPTTVPQEQECLPDLTQVAGALHAVRGFASAVERRQQNRDQQRDDADHDQHFDERKARLTLGTLHKEAPFEMRHA